MRARFWVCSAALLAVVVCGGGAAAFFLWPSAHLGAPGNALARIVLPRFAGKIDAVTVRSANGTEVPVNLDGGAVLPQGTVGSGQRLRIELTVRRPGWAAWLVGDVDHRTFTVETPSAHLLGRWLQVRPGGPVTVAFDTAGQRRLPGGQAAAPSPAANVCRADRAGGERDARHRRRRRRGGRAHLGAAVRGRARQLVPGASLSTAPGEAHARHDDRSQAGVHADVLEPGRRGAR